MIKYLSGNLLIGRKTLSINQSPQAISAHYKINEITPENTKID